MKYTREADDARKTERIGRSPFARSLAIDAF
jgi:hypothetical protein